MKPMSKALAASLAASEKARKSKRSLQVTQTQQVLDSVASRIIRKADGYRLPQKKNPQMPAECCGTHGLRPTWHGRA